MEIRSYSNMGPRVQTAPRGRSRTKQSFREESEINNILAKYVKTGVIDHVAKHGGNYDFASSVTFHEAMSVVVKAEQMFADLPADVRKRFVGEPGEFLDFVQNPENHEEMIALGLANRKERQGSDVVVPAVEAESARITPEVVPDAGTGDPAPAGP